MGLPAAIQVRERLQDMGCVNNDTICFLNHFSHNGGATFEDMSKAVKGQGFGLTYDEMTIAAAEKGFGVAWDGLEVEF